MSEKLDLGKATEDDVQRFTEHAFGVDFVFRAPFHSKGGKQRETTDVLAVIDDAAIAIQGKSQAYNSNGKPREESEAWLKKNLEKAVAQVSGAVRTLRGGSSVTLQNVRRGQLDFEPQKVKYFHGVVVLNHVSRPFGAADITPAITAADFPIHVFSFRDFYNLNRVLDTPFDLLVYLDMRAAVLMSALDLRVHEEEVAFTYYIDHLERIIQSSAAAHGDRVAPGDVAPYAQTLRRICRGNEPDLKQSYFIDRIIDRAHAVDETLPALFDREGFVRKSDYASIAAELASLPRPRRIYLARQFRAAIERAAGKADVAFVHAYSRRRDDCLLFVADPRPLAERSQRSSSLRDCVYLLKLTAPGSACIRHCHRGRV